MLRKEEKIWRVTNSNIDDILVYVMQVTTAKVVDHLKRFGLVAKPPESLIGRTVLDLKLKRNRSSEHVY